MIECGMEAKYYDWMFVSHPNMLKWNPNSSPHVMVLEVDHLLGYKSWVLIDGISVLKLNNNNNNKTSLSLPFLPGEDTVRRISELGSETRWQICWCLDVSPYQPPELWEMNGYCLSFSTYNIFVLIDWMDKDRFVYLQIWAWQRSRNRLNSRGQASMASTLPVEWSPRPITFCFSFWGSVSYIC